MRFISTRGALGAVLLCGIATLCTAQTAPSAAPPAAAPAAVPGAPDADAWKAKTDIPGLDFTGLSAAQKETALGILRSEGCGCGCGMKLAECRIKDPNCPASPKLAAAVLQGVKEGKSADAVKAGLAGVYQRPTPPPATPPPPPLAATAVEIPIAGSPFKGAADAKVVITEFSDFQ